MAATLLAVASILLATCGEQPPSPSPDPPCINIEGECEIIIDPGEHLVETDLEVGLDSWLEILDDPILSDLPRRSFDASGTFYDPSDESTTDESFWLHVFADESAESGLAWIKHLASQPPELASFIVPRHDVFEASFGPTPPVGAASVSLELLHGHSGGCWRSEVVIFVQLNLVIFLKSAIEITRDSPTTTADQAVAGALRQCDASKSASQITDIDAIAYKIFSQLIVYAESFSNSED